MLFGTNPGHRYAIHRCCFARLSKSLSVLWFSSLNAFQLLSKSHQFLTRSTLIKAVPCLVQSTPTHLEALLIHLKSFKAPPLQIVTNLYPSFSTLSRSVPRPIESTPSLSEAFPNHRKTIQRRCCVLRIPSIHIQVHSNRFSSVTVLIMRCFSNPIQCASLPFRIRSCPTHLIKANPPPVRVFLFTARSAEVSSYSMQFQSAPWLSISFAFPSCACLIRALAFLRGAHP